MAQMKAVGWMTALCASSAIAASAASGAVMEVWLGMLAPLTVVVGSLIVMARVHDQQPERLTSIMVVAFFGKLVFFGAYVGFVLGVLHVRLVPFAASFAAYFLALYAAEAVCLQRMLSERVQPA
jgi:hypothetical protein